MRIGDPSDPDLRDPTGNSNMQIGDRNPGGKVTKIGSSYSGGNVTGEASFQDANGSPLRGRPGGGFVSGSNGDGMRGGYAVQNDALMQRRAQEAALTQAAADRVTSAPMGQWEREKLAREANMDLTSRDPVRQKAGELALAQLGASIAANAAHRADLAKTQSTNEATLRANAATNATNLQAHQLDNATNLQAHKIDRDSAERVAMAPIEITRQQTQQMAMIRKAAAENNINPVKAATMMGASAAVVKALQEHETAQLANAGAEQTQISKATDDFNKRAEERFVDPATGKPDAANIAAFHAQVGHTIKQMVPALLASKDPAQVAYGRKLSAEGPRALDPTDVNKMFEWAANKRLIDQSRGVLPGSGSGSPTADLSRYQITGGGNDFWADGFKTAGGHFLPRSNAEYGPKANTWLWNWGAGDSSIADSVKR